MNNTFTMLTNQVTLIDQIIYINKETQTKRNLTSNSIRNLQISKNVIRGQPQRNLNQTMKATPLTQLIFFGLDLFLWKTPYLNVQTMKSNYLFNHSLFHRRCKNDKNKLCEIYGKIFFACSVKRPYSNYLKLHKPRAEMQPCFIESNLV